MLMKFKCECGEVTDYDDLPSPKIAFVGADTLFNPYDWQFYVYCTCGKRAYEEETKDNGKIKTDVAREECSEGLRQGARDDVLK